MARVDNDAIAKFMTSVDRKMMTNPSPMRPYTAPLAMPVVKVRNNWSTMPPRAAG